MESLMLHCSEFSPEGRLGWIHCPQLRTLLLTRCDEAVGFFIFKPMQDLLVLDHYSDTRLCTKLPRILPNLVSFTWSDSGRPLHHEIPRVALLSLKFLAVDDCHWETTTRFLKHLDVPLLEHLNNEHCFNVRGQGLHMVLDAICGDGAVQLRHLDLGDGALNGANFHAIWRHLKHLETLEVRDNSGVSADELFVPLSTRNHDFSFLCPQLKTVELSYLEPMSMSALVDFVQRRVKSDLGGPGPGLVTCLTLSGVWVDKEVSAQLAKTHSLSVHLRNCWHTLYQ